MRSGADRRSRRRVPVDGAWRAPPRPRSPGDGALGFDARASATAWLIGAGLEALDPQRRRRVIDGWHAYRDHGPRLVGDGGCDVRLGRVGVGRAERTALLALAAAHAARAGRLRGRAVRRTTPAHAVALLVRPPTIWPLEDAVDAERLFPRGSALRAASGSPRSSVHATRGSGPSISPGSVGPWPGSRPSCRRPGSRLRARPSPPVARSSPTDDSRARAVAARQLARYASSALVGACTREYGR